jgi:Coenzyme PQQ synthesis protein D (PqqD)
MKVMEMLVQENLSMESVLVVAKDQISCDLSGEAAILDLKSGVYYGLNAMGAFIWNQIQEPKSIAEVRDAIMDKYEVDAERCENDLMHLLGELVSRGLVELKDETSL